MPTPVLDLLWAANTILGEGLPIGLFALGLVVTYRYARLLDLTFAASFVAGPAAAVWALREGWPLVAALLAAVLVVLALAAFTSVLIDDLEVDPLMAGLLASFTGFALTLLLVGGTVRVPAETNPLGPLRLFDQAHPVGGLRLMPAQIALLAAVLLAARVLVGVFLRSEAGLAFRAMEDERSASLLLPSLGVSVRRVRLGAIVAGNLLCMAAGLLVVFKETQFTPQRGFDSLITAIAAYLLGTAIFERRPVPDALPKALARMLRATRRFEPATAALLGVLLYFTILSRALATSAPSSVPKLIVVALIVLALLASRWDVIARRRVQRERDITIPGGEHFVAREVCVAYPTREGATLVLEDVHLEVAPGTLTHVRGANGSGKSTLLAYLAGRTPGSGVIHLPGEGVDRLSRVALIGQDASRTTAATLTADEHLALFRTAGRHASPLRRWDRSVHGAGAIDVVPDLKSRSAPIGTFSGGQRQVLSVAALTLRSSAPAVVLLDEPLNHLDEPNAHRCVDLIERLKADGARLVLVQHDLPDGDRGGASARERLARLVDRRAVVAERRLVPED